MPCTTPWDASPRPSERRWGVVINLSEDSFLFDFDNAELRPANRELLSRIAGVLLVSYGYKLYVYGHTDDQGAPAYNQRLSERRAYAVRDYLAAAGLRSRSSTPRASGSRVRG